MPPDQRDRPAPGPRSRSSRRASRRSPRGCARRLAISASAAAPRATTAIACACTACAAASRESGSPARPDSSPQVRGGRLARRLKRGEVRGPAGLPGEQRARVVEQPGGGAQQLAVGRAAVGEVDVPVERVARLRRAPLEQLHEAGQRLVRGGQPGRAERRGGERGPQPLLGRPHRLRLGRLARRGGPHPAGQFPGQVGGRRAQPAAGRVRRQQQDGDRPGGGGQPPALKAAAGSWRRRRPRRPGARRRTWRRWTRRRRSGRRSRRRRSRT